MLRRFFVGVMLLGALVIILTVCMSIAPKEKECANISKKVAYLTFDDGPSNNTKKVLEILDRYNVKATFFVIGSAIDEKYIDQIKKMEEEGHSIGIHSYSHKYNQIYLSKEAYMKDFNQSKKLLDGILNKRVKIYRFPGGSCNCYLGSRKEDIICDLEEKGYKYYDWNVSGEDALNKPSTDSIIKNVVKDYKNFDNAIILLHDSATNINTVYALPTIIENIKNTGYEFGVLR